MKNFLLGIVVGMIVFVLGVMAAKHCPVFMTADCCEAVKPACNCPCDCGCCKGKECKCGEACPCKCGCAKTGKCDCCVCEPCPCPAPVKKPCCK